MSKQAEQIEAARRAYVAAIGTVYERTAKERMIALVDAAIQMRKQAVS
jgi:hypothetical protein